MADTEDHPAAPTAPAKAPARRAPRKSSAAKPAGTKSAAAQPAASRAAKTASSPDTPKATKPPSPAKPRTSSRSKPAAKRAAPAKKATTAVDDKGGRGWTKAALVGGLATVGAAATAALLSLRGSTAKKDAQTSPADEPVDPTSSTAHTPDGADATKSFKAGIADQNSIPE